MAARPKLQFGLYTVMIVVAIAAGVMALLRAHFQRANFAESRNDLKQFGLCMHGVHDMSGAFAPPAVDQEGVAPDKQLSWLAVVSQMCLPDIKIFNAIDFSTGYDAPTNLPAARTEVELFLCSAQGTRRDRSGFAVSHYAGVTGADGKPNGIFGIPGGTPILQVTDGCSNTIMGGQINSELGPWLATGRSTLRSVDTGLRDPKSQFGGPFSEGVLFLMADGSVRAISRDIDPAVLKALATRAAGD